MKDLVERLIQVEELAHQTYLAAARAFRGDAYVVGFLEHQAEDEARHIAVLRRALVVLGRGMPEVGPSAFQADPEVLNRVMGDLRVIQQRLAGPHTLSPAELAVLVEHAEHSEWNDLFVYVMRRLQAAGRDFQDAAAEMQEHRVSVDEFVNRTGALSRGRRPSRLAAIWTLTLLVVEDELIVGQAIEATLGKEFRIVTASNGQEALDLLAANRFDAVIADADMPGMDGSEFFRRAVGADPSLRGRFIFHAMPGHESLLGEAGVLIVAKPSPLSEFRRAVHHVLVEERERRG